MARRITSKFFQSGAAAVAHLARYPLIRLVKDNGDGSAQFELLP